MCEEGCDKMGAGNASGRGIQVIRTFFVEMRDAQMLADRDELIIQVFFVSFMRAVLL